MTYAANKLGWSKLWTLCPIYTSSRPREPRNFFSVRAREKTVVIGLNPQLPLTEAPKSKMATMFPKWLDPVFVTVGTWDTSSSSRLPLWRTPYWTSCVQFTHFLRFTLFLRVRPFLDYVPENKEKYQHNSRNDNKMKVKHVQSESNT